MTTKKRQRDNTGKIEGSVSKPQHFVLVGTYRKDQLQKWILPKGLYNYPIHNEDAAIRAAAPGVRELWLYAGKKGKLRFAASFKREVSVADLAAMGYPRGKEKPHSDRYLLFRVEPMPEEDVSHEVPRDRGKPVGANRLVARSFRPLLSHRGAWADSAFVFERKFRLISRMDDSSPHCMRTMRKVRMMGTKTTAKRMPSGRGPATHVLCAYPHRQQLKSTQIIDDCQRSLDLFEKMPDVLRVSHINPWARDEKNRLNPENGLCLSATYDAAFDRHLISFDEHYRLVVSKAIKDHYTGAAAKSYFINLEWQQMSLPAKFLPSQALLEMHRELLAG